jgi:site-specific DNA recombinase
MKKAVLYARVSSKEQEREGYSIPAQAKFLQEYAARQGITIVREFIDAETAKQSGRTNFNEMLKFLKRNRTVNIILVEKTDRLYRNLKDYVLLDELNGLEVHLVKEGTVLSDNARSHDKFIHGIKVLMAKNFIDNLGEEVKKGLNEKAEQGHYPSKPPHGYSRASSREIVINPDDAQYIRRAFELYSTGVISLDRTIAQLADEGFVYRPGMPKIAKPHLERLLKNPFYCGQFLFKGRLYKGAHEPLVSLDLFEKTQLAFKKDNKPENNNKHHFQFSGLIQCGECGCAVTADIKKGRYVYYKCTGRRGKCSQNKYIKEEVLAEQFEAVAKNITITPRHKQRILEGLKDSFKDVNEYKQERLDYLRCETTKLENRINTLYIDKIDGKIPEDFWIKKHNEFNSQLLKTQQSIINHQQAYKKYLEQGNILLEHATNAHSRYVAANLQIKTDLLNSLCSNFTLKDGKLSYIYNKPFDILAEGLNCKLEYASIYKVRTFLLALAA